MDIKKELDAIWDDPLLSITEKEAELFDIPADMKNVMEVRNKAEYVAQRKQCEDFDLYKDRFVQVHRDLKNGMRNLVRISKTVNLQAGHFYFIDGQMLLLEYIGEKRKSSNFLPDARTRCIYENGTESDILLQTLRKNVVGNGYAVTELQKEMESKFFKQQDVVDGDMVTGYVYVLKSLSEEPNIRGQKDLYKIGFTRNTVKERIANAEHEPTYLMAPVEIVATYQMVNLHSQKFEDLVHQVLKNVQFHVTVIDDNGISHEPKEWFVVPLTIVDAIIQRMMDGTIIDYVYNPQLKCLERMNRPSSSVQ